MDVGYFISELLAQHGDVSVPGLGYFVRARINGHYNEKEGKLYPPTYSVLFDPQTIEDETLAQYIVDRKNISLASSKYFTEKFITNIKLQAQSAETALGDLGWFYTDDSQLYFRPNTSLSTDPDFFGYQPVDLHKLGSAPVITNQPASDAAPVEDEYTAPIAVPQPQEETDGYSLGTDEEHEAYLTEQTRRRSRNLTITFVVLALVFIGLAVYLINRYDPSIFNLEAPKPKAAKTEAAIIAKVDTSKEKDSVKTTIPVDTASIKGNTAAKDTLSKVMPASVDSIGFPRWEVMGGTFKKIEAANTAIKNFKTLGVTAHIAEDVPGPRVHVSLGTYKTHKDAANAINALLKDKRISKKIYPLPIKHKK